MKNKRQNTRINEILDGMPEVLQGISLGHFNAFKAIYATNVEEGIALLEKLSLESIENIQFGDHQDISQDNTLSLTEQLMQISARWRVHKWVMANPQAIEWLSHRKDYYPLLLARYAETAISEKVTLPQIDVAWLIDLVGPILQGENRNRGVAAALSDRKYHDALLQFSAQLDRINTMLQYIQRLSDLESFKMFKFIQTNRDFFDRLIANTNFRISFARYVRANAEASKLLGAISGHSQELKQLLQIRNYQNILDNAEMFSYFSPLLNILLSGFLNGRLAMLIEFSNLSSTMTVHQKQYIETLTWCEQYRDILAISMSTSLEWHKWIMTHPNHEATIKLFSAELAAELNQKNVVDVRATKAAGEDDKYPSPMACFIDCIVGLGPQDRATSISCVANDVLLYQFLSHKNNHRVLFYIHQHIEQMTPVIEAFKHFEAKKLNQLMVLALSDPLQDSCKTPVKEKRSTPMKLPPKPKKKSRRLSDENVPELRLGH